MARSGLTGSLQTCWRAPARTSRTRWRGRGWRAARPPRPTPGREVRHSPARGPRPSPRGTGSPSRSPAPAPACPSPPPSSWWGERGHTWALPGSTLQPPRQAEAVPALRLRAQSSPGSSPSSPRPPSCTAPPPSSRAAPPWPWRRRPRCRWSSVSWVAASPSWRRSNTCQSAGSWRCWWGRSRPWPPPGRSCPAWTSPASCRGCSRSRPGGPAASSTWWCRTPHPLQTNSCRNLWTEMSREIEIRIFLTLPPHRGKIWSRKPRSRPAPRRPERGCSLVLVLTFWKQFRVWAPSWLASEV